MDTLEHLNETLVARKSEDPSTSYVASLYHGGVNKIAQKVGEEATEVVLAAKDAADDAAHKSALVAEVADLWFHSLVLLNHLTSVPKTSWMSCKNALASAVTSKKLIAPPTKTSL